MAVKKRECTPESGTVDTYEVYTTVVRPAMMYGAKTVDISSEESTREELV